MEKHNHLGYGSAAEEPTSCFFTNSNTWDFNPMDQNDPFQSALSSMVSSPAASCGGGGGGGENVMLRELIGRLGSICNSGEISLHSYNHIGGNTNTNTSTNTTCYSTPLNSPPKLNLTFMDHQMRGKLPFSGSHLSTKPNFISPSPSDPGFAERAARYSSYTNKDLGSLNGQIGMSDADFGQGLIPKFDGGASNSNWSLNVSGAQRDVQVEDNSIKSCFLISDKKVRKLWKSCTPENSGFGDSMEISSLTEHVTGGQSITNGIKEANPRKRKLSTKVKAKEPSSSSKDANVVASEKTDTDAKRSKSEEDNVVEKDGTNIKEGSNSSNGNKKSTGDENGNKKRPGDENGNNKKKQDKDDNSKDKVKDKVAEEEPPKDYIHVRARRGQATDAHSLAERVRREKISERMKLLQNLVPGCNLVTGKAVMLDEIINYVQSLQHQVEFLSMKLATINPRSEDLNVEAHLSKDVISHQGLLHHNNVYPSNASAPEFSRPFHPPQGPIMSGIENHYAMNNLNGSTAHNTTIQMPFSDNFGQVPSQVPAFWGNDLHTVVQMGVGQNQTQNYHGIMSTTQMKTEQ